MHLTAPTISYLDRGKSSIALGGGEREVEEEQECLEFWLGEVETLDDDSLAGQLINAVKAVTKRWLKQRKAEERDASARANREAALRRSRRVSQKSVAFEEMQEAFSAASADGELTANARQIMYAARPEIQRRSSQQLNDSYFTQTLLPDYLAEFDPPWKDQVAYDERGHFSEPHTDTMIGLGTVAVRHYLGEMREPEMQAGFEAKVKTHGPSGRFVGVFFVEKEGRPVRAGADRQALRPRLHVVQGHQCDGGA